jgi:hypothetical protein
MSTAVGDDRGFSTLGKEDGKGLTKEHGPLRTTL